jgi:hypothetical protein
MTIITLNSIGDVTPQVKHDLLINNLDKLIIKFDTSSNTGSSVIFDQAQKVIDFDIEVDSRYASDLFLNLKNLTSINKSLNLRNACKADNLFSGCEKLMNLPQIHFDRDSDLYIDRYHFFCDYDLRKGEGLTGIRECYFEKELNPYPAWYFRSAISEHVFNFRIFFDEIFKFIFSYRGLDLDTWFSPFFKCKINKIGRSLERIKYAIDNKLSCLDLDNISYSHPNPRINFSKDLFRYFGTYDFSAVKDSFIDFKDFVYNKCHSTLTYELMSLAKFFRNNCDFGYLYDQFPLNGFTIEFSKEKRYFKTGIYKISDVVDEGKVVLKNHSSDAALSDIILKILDALQNKGKKTPDSGAEVITSDEFAEKSLRDLSEIIDHNHEISIEESDRHQDRDSDDDSDEYYDRQSDNPNKGSHAITESLYDIDLSVLDELPDELPTDVKEWIEKVKNIEVYNVMLGCFVPGAYPLKIVMYTETIKEVAGKDGISAIHLFETTLAHEFFHALHFVMCLLEKFSDISLLSDIFKEICRIMDPKRLSAQNVHREIWLQLQKETLNHWHCANGSDISSQVLEPLAVAFEISWVKDRIITQKHNMEWQKIMEYELSRFDGLGSYPSDPYCGAKYLISRRKNHRKLADMETINTNISAVLQRSLDSMRSAYVLIQNSLAW